MHKQAVMEILDTISFIKWKPNICVKIRQEEINLSKCLQDNSQCKSLFFEKHGSIVISLQQRHFFKKKDCLW